MDNKVDININFDLDTGDYDFTMKQNGEDVSLLMHVVLGILENVKGNIVFLDGIKAGDNAYSE